MSWGVCVCVHSAVAIHMCTGLIRFTVISGYINVIRIQSKNLESTFFLFLTLGYKLTLGRIGRNNLTTFFIVKKVYQDWFTKHSSKSIQKTMSICPFPWNDFTKMASSVQHFNHRPLKYQGTFKHQVVSAIFLVPFFVQIKTKFLVSCFCSNKDNIFSSFLLFK